MQHSGLNDTAYFYIKNKLLHNEIRQGERIREDFLAEEMEISRTPVREAINRLVAEGFVVNIRRKGLFAAEISDEELIRMLDVRIALETLAVRLCCQNISEEQLACLNHIYDQYARAMAERKYSDSSIYDAEFHKYIAECAGNKKLAVYINDLQEFMAFARARRRINWTEERMKRSLSDHKALLEVIGRRDQEQAMVCIERDIRELKTLMEA